MKHFRVSHLLGVLVTLGLLSAIPLRLLPRAREAWTVKIATATPGGTYYPLGSQLAHILRQLPPIHDASVWETSGGAENIRLLGNPTPEDETNREHARARATDRADLAFVGGTTLAAASSAERGKIRAIAALYLDVIQLVARRDAEIRGLEDLRSKRLYTGKDHSGTKLGADTLLSAAGLRERDYTRVGAADSYRDASRRLQQGELDAAFFYSGTPTDAVKDALLGGECHLVDVTLRPDQVRPGAPLHQEFTSVDIPANFYAGQHEPIRTLATQVVLAARKDLDDDLVRLVLESLFDHIDDLLLAHSSAVDIKFHQQRAFDSERLGLELHPGAVQFWEQESDKLFIATGTITGNYYRIGKVIETLLEHNGVPARAIHTQGSVENAGLLNDPARPTLAIMQYDTALVAHLGRSGPVFKKEIDVRGTDGEPIRVEGLRRVAAFHEEKIHLLIREDKLPDRSDPHPTVEVLENRRVCVGPKNSGTRILMEALLMHHGLTLDSIQAVSLPVPEMVNQLHAGDVDAGVFVEGVPSQALQTVLADSRFRLLSVDRRHLAAMLGPALKLSRIEPGTYACQREGAPAIDTITTRAVFVTTQDLGFDVGKITRILFEGAGFLGIDGGAATMAADIPSLPLHPAAAAYYREAALLPAPPSFDWLKAAYYFLAILVILLGGYKGLLKLRRDMVRDELSRRIFAVSMSGRVPDSVQRLTNIRSDLDDRVKRRWWIRGEVDTSRWQFLSRLIQTRIEVGKETLTRALLTEIRGVSGKEGLEPAERIARLAALEEKSWKHLEAGELDEAQHTLLLKVIRESPHSLPHHAEAEPRRTEQRTEVRSGRAGSERAS